MTGYLFSIVTTFQIWACDMMFVEKLSETFIALDDILNFRKIY